MPVVEREQVAKVVSSGCPNRRRLMPWRRWRSLGDEVLGLGVVADNGVCGLFGVELEAF
jgi:hypothetical protein